MFTKPKGPIGALFVGMIYPASEGEGLLMSSYKPELFDLGRIDDLSPPWLRQQKNKPENPEELVAWRGAHAKTMAAYLGHHGNIGLQELGRDCRCKVVCERLRSKTCPGSIGFALTLHIESKDAIGQFESAEEAAKAWGRAVLLSIAKPLRGKPVSKMLWESCPDGCAKSVLKISLGYPSPEDHARGAQWASALLAQEESIELSQLKVAPKTKAKEKTKPVAKRL